MIGIYKITSPSGKVYIGQSWNIEKRFKFYKYLLCKKQKLLYNSLKKYGYDKHKFEVLKTFVSVKQKTLDNWEIHFIDKFKKSSLNIRLGGSGGRMSEKQKAKLSELRKGIAPYPGAGEFLRKINLGNTYSVGRILSEETKRKIGEKSIGRTLSKKSRQQKIEKCYKSIIQFTTEMILVKEHNSLLSGADAVGISSAFLCSHLKGRKKTAGGFIWKYKQ